MTMPTAVPLSVLDTMPGEVGAAEDAIAARLDGDDEDSDALDRFRAFIDRTRMTDRQRSALNLHLRGMNYQDIGREVGCSRRVAKRRVLAAIERLRRAAITAGTGGGGMSERRRG